MTGNDAVPLDSPHTPTHGFSRAAQGTIYRDGLSGTRSLVPVHPDVLQAAAHQVMSPEASAYVTGSAGAERTAAANRAAFDRWQIWPRVLRDVSQRDLSTELFGARRPTPFVLAPLGVMEMLDAEADVAVARAAAALGVPYTLSNQASRPMEEVVAATPDAPHWFQLYWTSSDELNASLLGRAAASGCEAIVITLDTHLFGWRTRDLDLAYSPFSRGLGIAQYTSDPVFARLVRERVQAAGGSADSVPAAEVETFQSVFSTPTLTWGDLAKARAWTTLPIILKGIMHPDDATAALDAGVDGVWVSNHGGRQVDQSVPTLAALPEIAERLGGRVPIVFDSGIRGGADAAIALALGASVVAIARPYAYGLAIAGQAGVQEVVRNHIAELEITMALAGHTSVGQLGTASVRAV